MTFINNLLLVFSYRAVSAVLRKLIVRLAIGLSLLFLSACSLTGVPDGLSPVSGFELDRYLGRWYEIARLDHRFERGLQQVTAEYSLNADGSVKVVNSGVSESTGKRKTATGRARFVGDAALGHLKVSFFGPFYGSYVIIELDSDTYNHALVAGPSRRFLWVLARQPELDDVVYQSLVMRAKESGFAVEQLIKVVH